MKKGILIALTALYVSVLSLNAQSIKWAFPITPVSEYYGINPELSSLCIDNNDNLYAITSIYGEYDLDTTEAENLIGEEDYSIPVLTKFSSDGTFQWSKTVIKEANGWNSVTDATCDAEGNIYITGYFENEIDFNPGEEEFLMNATDGEEMFILKLNSDGEFLWAKQYGGADAYTNANAIKVTATNIYIAGDFNGEVQFDTVYESNGSAEDAFALKLALDGTIVWSYYFGGDHMDEATAIDVDANGDVYVAGYFRGEDVEFAKGGYTEKRSSSDGGRNEDLFVAKISNDPFLGGDRSVDYVKVVGGYAGETCRSLLVNAANEVYFSGTISGITDFNYSYSSSVALTPNDVYDTYFAKLNSYGGSPQAVQGNYYMNYDDDELAEYSRGLYLRGDYLYVYEKNIPRIYNATDLSLVYNPWIDGTGIEMVVGSDGAIYALGKIEETADLYPVKFDDEIVFNLDTDENFVLYKLDPELATSVSKKTVSNTFEVYPTPATDEIFFANNEGLTNVAIYNVQGVLAKSVNKVSNNSISVSDLPAGLYIIKAQFEGNSVKQSRIVVQ